MKFFSRLFSRRSGIANPQKWLIDYFTGGTKSAAGINVTPDTALQASAVYACVRVLAETIASLPLHVYKRLEGSKGKEKAPEHYLYPVLHEIANPEMTSFELRETMVGHLCLRGNAYAEKVFDRAGRVKELWPLNPDGVLVERDKATKQLIYIITLPGESKQVKLSSDRILHIRGLSGNGIIGYSPIALAKESIGLALATEEYGSRFFGNASRPSGVLEHPGKLGKDAADRLKKSWEEMHRGLSNAHRVAILEEGLKWNQIGMSQEDSQYLQTRQYQVVDIARIFRVPPHMIAELSRATFSNIEFQSIDFVVNTLRPWLVRFEQAFKQRLFDETDREYYAEFLIDGLLRGDIASRYSAYAIGRQWGWLSADDIREMENRNPLPDGQGETYLVPLNMVPAGETAKIGDIAKEPPKNDDEKQKTRDIFVPIMKDVGMRIVRRERADILRQLKKSKDIESFREWLDAFYEEHTEFIRKNISPVFEAYNKMAGYIDIMPSVELYINRHIANLRDKIITLTDSKNYDTTTLVNALEAVFNELESEATGGKIN